MALVSILLASGLKFKVETQTGPAVSKVTLRTTQYVDIGYGDEILSFTFPFTPNNISIDGLSDEYALLDRPGRFPLVSFSKRKPLTVSLKTLITATTGRGVDSAEENIARIANMARSRSPVIVTGFGLLVSGTRFYVTDFTTEAVRLNSQQDMVMANATITLTQASSPITTVPGMIAIKDASGPSAAAVKTGKTSATGSGEGFWERSLREAAAPQT